MKIDILEIAQESYCKEDYNYHILPVVKNALALAEKLGADKEIVETAAFLHDIGRATERNEFVAENEHHITGEKKTREILSSIGCEKTFIEAVAECVLCHRGRAGPEPKTIEAKIIACADAMSHFDTFLDLFKFFLTSTNSFEEAVNETEAKMLRDWNKKLAKVPIAQEMKKEKFEAIMILLKSMKEWTPK